MAKSEGRAAGDTPTDSTMVRISLCVLADGVSQSAASPSCQSWQLCSILSGLCRTTALLHLSSFIWVILGAGSHIPISGHVWLRRRATS